MRREILYLGVLLMGMLLLIAACGGGGGGGSGGIGGNDVRDNSTSGGVVANTGAEQQKLEAKKRRLAAEEAEAEKRRLAIEAEDRRKEKRRLAAAKKSRLAAVEAEAEKRRLAIEAEDRRKEEALAEAKRQEACAPGVSFADGSTCSFSRAQYDVQVERTVAQQFRSVGYKNQWGLATIRADVAYANLRLQKGQDAIPGAGVRIGVLDSEIDPKHPAFEGRSIQIQGTQIYGGTGRNVPESLSLDQNSHGTGVASVIIARPDVWDEHGKGFPGIAWGADLKMFAAGTGISVSSRDEERFFSPDEMQARDDSYEAEMFQEMLLQVDFLNLSFGYTGIIDDYTKERVADHYGRNIEVWTQAHRPDKTVLIWAAGNSNGDVCKLGSISRCERSAQDAIQAQAEGRIRADSPDVEPGIPLYFPELRGHTIAVVGVGPDGKISELSNRCGTAADWCIAAPGREVSVARYKNRVKANGVPSPLRDIATASGTSYAAPMVSGSLAVKNRVKANGVPSPLRDIATASGTSYAAPMVSGSLAVKNRVKADGVPSPLRDVATASGTSYAAPMVSGSLAVKNRVKADGVPSPLRDVATASGTSYAVPMVSGSLAVMKGLFGDQLSNTDLVVRLFATANKTGRYADEKVYGQGLLDLGAATSPVGEPVIVVVGSIVARGVPLAMTSLASGKAFGDSLLRSVSGEGVVTFDALGAPFSYDLGSFVGYAKSSSLQERLQTLMDSEDVLEEGPAYGLSAPVMTTGRRFFPGGRVSRTRNGREASGDVSSGVSFGRVADKGHLSVAKGALMVSWEDREGGLSATAFGTAEPSSTATMRGYTTTPTGYPAGHAEKPHTSGGVVAWQPSGAPIGLRAGWMTEQGSVLGASGRGAFGSLTGQTGFVGLHTGWKTDTWSVHASAEFGTIASTPEKSLIKDISGVITSTFGLSATRSFGAGRALQVSLSQPLRVESGRASFVVPVARTKSGSVVRRSFTSGLSPSGRQIDFSLSWHHRVSESSRVHLSGILTHNPGHRANAKPEAALLLGWKHSF